MKDKIKRLVGVWLGTAMIGLGISLLVKSKLGTDPWTVFYQGVTNLLGETFGWNITLGRTNQTFGLLFLIFISIVDKIKLSFKNWIGTFINFIFVGIFIDVFMELPIFLSRMGIKDKILPMILGILVYSIGIGIYVGAGLGEGPLELLMMYLVKKTKKEIGIVKITMDAVAVSLGVFLSGVAGIGTLLCVIFTGPIIERIIKYTRKYIYGENLFFKNKNN